MKTSQKVHSNHLCESPRATIWRADKDKLGNSEVRGIVDKSVAETLEISSQNNPKQPKLSSINVSLASRARMAARSARETIIRKGALEGLTPQENSLTVRQKIHQNQKSISSRETQRVVQQNKVETVISRHPPTSRKDIEYWASSYR